MCRRRCGVRVPTHLYFHDLPRMRCVWVWVGFIILSYSTIVASKSRFESKQEQEGPSFVEKWELDLMTEWPQAVGRDAKEVGAEIKAQNPSFKVVAVPEGSPVTMDYSTERVRVYYNKEGVVAS